jgi:ribosomal protein S18 acetylase RimI-like enzyme
MANHILSNVQIRHITKSDLPLLEWDGEFIHFRRVYANAFKRAQQGHSLLWAAAMPGSKTIIGQIFIQISCNRPELADGVKRAYFYSFRVRPSYRSLGVGKKLLWTAETELHRRGFEFITCNVAKENQRAISLYEQIGYIIVSHEPGIWSYQDHKGVWHQVVEPAWRMEKKLKPH